MAAKPFLIEHRDGRRYELAGDADGKDAYREYYMHQGFALVDPQPDGWERPDLSEPKAKKSETKDAPAEQRTTDADAGATDRVVRQDMPAEDTGKRDKR
jgi:hypothetical protein